MGKSKPFLNIMVMHCYRERQAPGKYKKKQTHYYISFVLS